MSRGARGSVVIILARGRLGEATLVSGSCLCESLPYHVPDSLLELPPPFLLPKPLECFKSLLSGILEEGSVAACERGCYGAGRRGSESGLLLDGRGCDGRARGLGGVGVGAGVETGIG